MKKSSIKHRRGNWGLNRIRKSFPQVTTVSDSRKRVEVTVTEKDCIGAKKSDFGACVFAKACRRLKGVDGALIGLTYSYLISGTHATRYCTPPTLGREIVTFDRHKDFDLGSYHLSKVPPSQHLGRRSSMGPGRGKGNGNGPYHVQHQTARVRRVK